MDIRGERECQTCGARWSYFDTGEIACPDCGSARSVGVGERRTHTGGRSELDLSDARAAVETEPIDQVADLAVEAARGSVRAAGFVDGGNLRPLADEDLLARELEAVGSALSHAMRVSDDEEHYLLALLRAPVEDGRPGPDEVPDALTPARGLAVARAVGDYHRDLRSYLSDPGGDLATALSAIRARRKRIEALDGDVDPRKAERLVGAIRDVYAYLERDDEAALARITERFRD